MRNQLLRLTRSNSTKSERRIAEVLKAHRIKFKARARIGRYEVDFLIGRVALEVDGSVHRKINPARDTELFKQGYVPLHVRADAVKSPEVVKEIINLIRNNNGKN